MEGAFEVVVELEGEEVGPGLVVVEWLQKSGCDESRVFDNFHQRISAFELHKTYHIG